MPSRRRLSFPVALLAAVTLAACATMRNQNNLQPHPITITVDNNLRLPTDLTVYSVSTAGVQILGSAIPAKTTSFRMTPRSFSEPYRLLARTPSGQRIWSEEYTVRDANTGEIVWRLVPNILQFFDMPGDSAAAPATPATP